MLDGVIHPKEAVTMNDQKHCERMIFERGIHGTRFGTHEAWVDRVLVVVVSGDVDVLTAPELASALREAGRREPAALIVDLSRVTFLAVAGINELLVARLNAPGAGGFAVVADGPVTGRPLVTLGLDGTLSQYRSLVDALDAVAR